MQEKRAIHRRKYIHIWFPWPVRGGGTVCFHDLLRAQARPSVRHISLVGRAYIQYPRPRPNLLLELDDKCGYLSYAQSVVRTPLHGFVLGDFLCARRQRSGFLDDRYHIASTAGITLDRRNGT